MFAFLTKLFAKSEVCPRCALLEERLFQEIDSNRLRENELVASVLEAAKIHLQPGARTPLVPRRLKDSDENGVIPENPFLELAGDDEFEQQQMRDVLEMRITEFIENAEARGTPYTQDARAALRIAVYQNPQEYL